MIGPTRETLRRGFHKVYGEHVTIIFDIYEKRYGGLLRRACRHYIHEFGKDINFFGS